MAAFDSLDWGNLDVLAILVGGGVATLEPAFADRSLAWLRSRAYLVDTLDFASGIGEVVTQLGIKFQWEKQFGYRLEPTDRNLARLRDGFWYPVANDGGLALELQGFEGALQEDREWSLGFLGVLSEHSLRQLALGRRFFALVHVASGESPLVGAPLIQRSVPYPYPLPYRASEA